MRNLSLSDITEISKRIMPKGSHVWLYGSRARGDAHADSDWDILVLIDKDKIENSDHDKYSYPLVELGWERGATVSPILYSTKEWNGYSFTPFYKNVEHDKIEIL